MCQWLTKRIECLRSITFCDARRFRFASFNILPSAIVCCAQRVFLSFSFIKNSTSHRIDRIYIGHGHIIAITQSNLQKKMLFHLLTLKVNDRIEKWRAFDGYGLLFIYYNRIGNGFFSNFAKVLAIAHNESKNVYCDFYARHFENNFFSFLWNHSARLSACGKKNRIICISA